MERTPSPRRKARPPRSGRATPGLGAPPARRVPLLSSPAALCLALLLAVAHAQTDLAPGPPGVGAAAAFLVQAQSGAVLYDKEAFEARPPASLTKMVTALVVVERCGLADVATVSASAAGAEGSTLGLREGDRITVGELLKGLMLPSGNDAARCLAEHVAGSEPAFVELVNAKVAELGAVNTHFANASGLTAEGHYSCARDLALFAIAVRLHPDLSQIIGMRSATVKWCDGHSKTVYNRNRLLPRCRGCDGVKTGFTTPAGRCLAASAQRNGYALVAVVLHSPDSWVDSGRLLEWGFGQPPVGIVEVPSQTGGEPSRIPAPIVRNRVYVPVGEFLKALGFAVECTEGKVRATAGGAEVTCSVAEGCLVGEAKQALSAEPVVWHGQIALPAADLCRMLGLQLAFDKPSLTARVSQTQAAATGRPAPTEMSTAHDTP